ncbi:DUF6276 family protein [Halocatena pleomorpha]|uniref:Small CPxCG-related zinc finger protein n=1 Tax=Halocatena pleomorpha TaxID=1785090 RepID=A0A3P3RAR6_9EURY|nr:DUF6276 family protein [Halocatena pleomorpha]RRJ30475.1 hypothetical protein EIK79_09315 [Halocatena pleomorpha]
MSCPDCDAPLVSFVVPADLREYAPTTTETLAICTQCLTLYPPTSNATPEATDFSRISDAFPTGEAAVPMAIVLGLLESLALNRSEIEQLIERVERAGADPLLLLDKLDRQGSVDPQWDVSRRRHQLQQFLTSG